MGWSSPTFRSNIVSNFSGLRNMPKVAAPVLKTEINCRGDPLSSPRDTLYPQNLALTSLTSCGRSVGIVRLRTKGHGVFFKEILRTMPSKKASRSIAGFLLDKGRWTSTRPHGFISQETDEGVGTSNSARHMEFAVRFMSAWTTRRSDWWLSGWSSGAEMKY
jgi:hypothetical protein